MFTVNRRYCISLAKVKRASNPLKTSDNDAAAVRRTLLLEGPVAKALFRLALPITLGNVLQTGYQMTDAFWVGRIGEAAVAAVAVSFPITFLVIALGSGLAIAGATLSSQYMGAGRQDLVDHVAGQTILMVIIASAFFGSAGYLLSPVLLRSMG
jgi:Na+-driven multidrug efflux pump